MLNIAQMFGIYVGQSASLIIALIIFQKTEKVKYWVIADIIGMVGVTLIMLKGFHGNFNNTSSATLNLISNCIRTLGLSERRIWTKRNRFALAFVIASLALVGLYQPLLDTDFRSLMISSSAICAAAAGFLFTYCNREWKSLPGRYALLAAYAAGGGVYLVQLVHSYPLGSQTRLISNTQTQLATLASLLVLSFLLHMAFINLSLDRSALLERQRQRKDARIKERNQVLALSNRQIGRLAGERLNLIKMMTHEVRQPLNNAQAALQAVMSGMNAASSDPGQARQAAVRVQLILDEVTLALSNSIVAASIIEWRKNPTVMPLGANDMLALAAKDCPSSEVDRLVIAAPEDEIFISADPVLIRLALRNLLSNALKYSPPNSPVHVRILIDEERYGVAFQCTNTVDDARLLQGDLLLRGKRGMDNSYEGHGLGLFMVNETARIHHGELTYWQSSPDAVTFELMLPC